MLPENSCGTGISSVVRYQVSGAPLTGNSANSTWKHLENLHRVPDGYYSVMGELFKHLYNLEALFNRSLDEHAMIEISIGLHWSRYVREVVGIADQHRCKYAHVCQGGRIEQMWASALHYVTIFDKWLWEVYFPQHFPDYERNLAKYPGLPGPRTRKQLTRPILSWQRSCL